jgi:hypothetical protein
MSNNIISVYFTLFGTINTTYIGTYFLLKIIATTFFNIYWSSSGGHISENLVNCIPAYIALYKKNWIHFFIKVEKG